MKRRKLITKSRNLILISLLTLCVYSCSNDSEDDLINTPDTSGSIEIPEVTDINYTDNIRSIMQNACVSCHANPPVNGAPFALVNFDQVSQRATSVLSRMSLQSGAPGAMPPSGRLPQATIDLIQQWINDGKQEN